MVVQLTEIRSEIEDLFWEKDVEFSLKHVGFEACSPCVCLFLIFWSIHFSSLIHSPQLLVLIVWVRVPPSSESQVQIQASVKQFAAYLQTR